MVVITNVQVERFFDYRLEEEEEEVSRTKQIRGV